MFRWLELCLFGVIAWQLAGLFWSVFAPSTEKVGLAMPRQAASNVSQEPFLRWYATDTKAADEAPSDYSLMAVIAGKDGVAVLKGKEGPSLAIRTGNEIQPGSKLIEVEPRSVRIEQNGVRKDVTFPQTAPAPLIVGSPESVAAGSKASTANARNAPQRIARLRPIRITRGQMVATMQSGNIAGWDKGLSSPPEGGIRIEQTGAQPLMKLLQLNDGDLIKRINQRPLNKLADISLISYYFGQSASVDIDLIRNGVAMVQHYDIQP